MEFDLVKSLQVLERTPAVLSALLTGMADDWVLHNEGGDSWSPYDIIGHLVHGERTDWMNRVEIILNTSNDKKFISFNREAHFSDSKGSLQQLLDEFDSLRKTNLIKLKSLVLSKTDFEKTGIHPEFGEVTLAELLSTWTVHDLAHISQITRVMAKQYKSTIGPWINYFPRLQ